MKSLTQIAVLAGLAPFLVSNGADAQDNAAALYRGQIQRIANTCVGHWEARDCITNISGAAFKLAADHANSQLSSGHLPTSLSVSGACALAASARNGEERDAHSMRNAFVDCLNAISDAVRETKAPLDLGQYSIVLTAVQCIDKDQVACPETEARLREFSVAPQ